MFAEALVEVVEGGRFVSSDGRIHFPILRMAAADRRSPERVARALVERAPAAAGEYVRPGREEGFSEDDNHFTVLLGENAPREVFPRIAAFLRRHSEA